MLRCLVVAALATARTQLQREMLRSKVVGWSNSDRGAAGDVRKKPGYWRVVARELRNYCECRVAETGAAGGAASVGLAEDVYEAGSCRVRRGALVAHAADARKLTVVVMAYQPHQWRRLDRLTCGYAKNANVRKILLLWNGPHDAVPNATCAVGWRERRAGFRTALLRGAPPRYLAPGARPEPVELEVVVEKTNTLLNRYRHAKRCATDAVLLQDDDIFHHPETLEAFSWMRLAAPRQIIGTPPERHFKVEDGEYAYVFHPQKTQSKQYSFLLGQTNLVRRSTLEGFVRRTPRAALAYILAHKPTCEDLTLHFFNANATGLPPIVFQDLRPETVMGSRSDQMHTAISKKIWNKRRERCLARLAADFGGMVLQRSRCRVRGNVTAMLEREAAGDTEGLWRFTPRVDGLPENPHAA